MDGVTKKVEIRIVVNGAKEAQQDLNTTQGSFKNFSGSVFKGVLGANIAFGALKKGISITTRAVDSFVRSGIEMSATLETAKQGFVTLLGSTEKADEAIKMIKKDAASTPFEFVGLVKANQMLTQVTKNAPRSERLLLNVGKALAAAGKGSEELDRIILNLQQIANTGQITQLDIRQFGYAGVNILELLADYYDTTKAKAQEMLKGSKDAFGDLEKAFQKAGEGGGRFSQAFILQAGTFAQVMSNMRDNWNMFTADMVQRAGIFDGAKILTKGLSDTLALMNTNTEGQTESFGQLSETVKSLAGTLNSLLGVMASPEGINVMTTAIKGLNWALEGLVGFLRQATGELTVFDMFSNKKKIESGLTDRARENLRKAKENPNLLKGSTSTTNINFSGGVNFGAYSKNSKQAQTTFSNLLLNVSR